MRLLYLVSIEFRLGRTRPDSVVGLVGPAGRTFPILELSHCSLCDCPRRAAAHCGQGGLAVWDQPKLVIPHMVPLECLLCCQHCKSNRWESGLPVGHNSRRVQVRHLATPPRVCDLLWAQAGLVGFGHEVY